MKKRNLIVLVAALAAALSACGTGNEQKASETVAETKVTQASTQAEISVQSEKSSKAEAAPQTETAAQTQAAPQTQAAAQTEAVSQAEMKAQAQDAGLANPWVDTDEAGVMELTGLRLGVPDGACDVSYRVNQQEGFAEMNFQLENGEQCSARIKATPQEEDISGMYYQWEYEDKEEYQGRTFRLYQAQDGKLQLCTWFDAVPGISYSLSVRSDHDMNGFDIFAVALGVFEPMQSDVAGDEESTQEGDLISTNYKEYAGVYTSSYDGSTLELSEDGSVKIDLFRLAELEGKANGIYKGIIMLSVTDPNGGAMGLEFMPEDATLVVTDSTWGLLPNGESFTFDQKK